MKKKVKIIGQNVCDKPLTDNEMKTTILRIHITHTRVSHYLPFLLLLVCHLQCSHSNINSDLAFTVKMFSGIPGADS